MGWLLLDNPHEALQELRQIHTLYRNHPDVLELQWTLQASQSDWLSCLKTGQMLVELAPERVSSWIHHAYALRRVDSQGLQRAWDALIPAADRFPRETIVPYNLACYACQKEDLTLAREWLKRAWEIAERSGEKSRWMTMALLDPDLESLWSEIRQADVPGDSEPE